MEKNPGVAQSRSFCIQKLNSGFNLSHSAKQTRCRVNDTFRKRQLVIKHYYSNELSLGKGQGQGRRMDITLPQNIRSVLSNHITAFWRATGNSFLRVHIARLFSCPKDVFSVC